MSNVDQQKIRRKIQKIVKSIGVRGIANSYRSLAIELNVMAGRSWSWNYLHSVQSGALDASLVLAVAIDRLYELRDGLPRAVLFEDVTVVAPMGLIQEETYLTIPARKCCRPTCNKSFIPGNPNQKYCMPYCRRLSKKLEPRRTNASQKSPPKLGKLDRIISQRQK